MQQHTQQVDNKGPRDDVCTRGNRAQARLRLEQCEVRAAGDRGGGTIMPRHGMRQLGQVCPNSHQNL